MPRSLITVHAAALLLAAFMLAGCATTVETAHTTNDECSASFAGIEVLFFLNFERLSIQ